MSYTVRQFVEGAFEEIGMAAYVFDLTPDMMQSAAGRLYAMLAEWNAKGIRLGGPSSSNPAAIDLDTATNIPDSANETIIASLAVRLAPAYGKTVSQDTKITAKQGYNTILSRATFPPEQQFPTGVPAGAGNKPWRWDNPFLNPPVDPLLAGQDGPLDWN